MDKKLCLDVYEAKSQVGPEGTRIGNGNVPKIAIHISSLTWWEEIKPPPWTKIQKYFFLSVL